VRRTPSVRPRRARWLGLALVPGLAGCAAFWDDVTSRDFRERPFQTVFTAPDAVAVLRHPNSTGDERARALRRLKEPWRHGGSAAEQDEAVQFLSAAALNDRQPLCRLAAVETLGRFQDPRAVQVLMATYARLQPDTSTTLNQDVDTLQARRDQIWERAFAPETVTLIQCRTLQALGESKQPAAVPVLLTAVKTQPKADASEAEKQQARDLRTAAVRALGNFPNDQQVTAALVQTLRTERDVALRDRTHESLVAVTGRDLPPDAVAWQQYLDNPAAVPPSQPSVIQQVGGWFRP